MGATRRVGLSFHGAASQSSIAPIPCWLIQVPDWNLRKFLKSRNRVLNQCWLIPIELINSRRSASVVVLPSQRIGNGISIPMAVEFPSFEKMATEFRRIRSLRSETYDQVVEGQPTQYIDVYF
jgi:hypothetical protein